MNSKLLIAASAVALMFSSVSYAETIANETVKEDLKDAGKAISGAAEKTKENAKEVYEKIKAALITDNEVTSGLTHVDIDMRMTALGILNKPIFNTQNEKIGDVADIILGSNGKAEAIIVSHGGFLSIGDRDAAFDYDLVMRRDANGDVVMPVSKDVISTAKEFSYDRTEKGDKIRIISRDAVSLKDLLKGKVNNYKNEPVANIENIFFKDGLASQVIIGFDQMLGMGGERAVMDFRGIELVHKEGKYDFRLNQAQSVQFEKFVKIVKK